MGRRRIQSTTPGNAGAQNDKTNVKFDSFVHALRTDPAYTRKEYILRTKDGGERTVRGVYQLVDQGYLAWRVLQCPSKSNKPAARRWSKQLESVRKDVECVFG